LLLAPFAPYLCRGTSGRPWEKGHLLRHPWPEYDAALAKEEDKPLRVQNQTRKLAAMSVPLTARKNCPERVLADEKSRQSTEGKTGAWKVIVVLRKALNMVVR